MPKRLFLSFFTPKCAQRLVLFERKKDSIVEKQVRIRVEKKKEPADSRSKGRILGEIKSRVKEESFESELFEAQEGRRWWGAGMDITRTI